MTHERIREFGQFEVSDDRLDDLYTICSVQPSDQSPCHRSMEFFDTRTIDVPAERGVVWVCVYLDHTCIEPIGWAQFALSEAGNHCVNVRVDETYRRRGVASAMYDIVERNFGCTIEPSTDRSDDATLFWINRTGYLAASPKRHKTGPLLVRTGIEILKPMVIGQVLPIPIHHLRVD